MPYASTAHVGKVLATEVGVFAGTKSAATVPSSAVFAAQVTARPRLLRVAATDAICSAKVAPFTPKR